MLLDLVRSGETSRVVEALGRQVFSEEEIEAALLEGIRLNSETVVRELMKASPDLNKPCLGRAPLACAIEHERVSLVELLLEGGAEVHRSDENGFSPLHLAVDVEADSAWQLGQQPVSKLTSVLVRYGADPSQKDKSGQTPLDLAIEYKHEGAIECFRKARNVEL